MKVRIFCESNKKTLEERINDFIKDKCVVNMLQSQVECNCCVCTTITILYEDDYCCDYLKTVIQS